MLSGGGDAHSVRTTRSHHTYVLHMHTQERKLRFEVCRKRYTLHFIPTAEPPGQADELVGAQTSTTTLGAPGRYGCGADYEALYEGYFLSAQSARQYVALFSGNGPYENGAVEVNAAQLALLVCVCV